MTEHGVLNRPVFIGEGLRLSGTSLSQTRPEAFHESVTVPPNGPRTVPSNMRVPKPHRDGGSPTGGPPFSASAGEDCSAALWVSWQTIPDRTPIEQKPARCAQNLNQGPMDHSPCAGIVTLFGDRASLSARRSLRDLTPSSGHTSPAARSERLWRAHAGTDRQPSGAAADGSGHRSSRAPAGTAGLVRVT